MSEWFDSAARRLVERAYAVKGEWAGVYVAPPSGLRRGQLEALGIDPWQRDRWGEQRWIRAFKRSVYHAVNYYGGVSGLRPIPNIGAGEHGWHSPVRVEWETGDLVSRAGWPTRRRAVRIRIHPGGPQTSAVGQREDKRWVDDAGYPTRRQSLPIDPNSSERN